MTRCPQCGRPAWQSHGGMGGTCLPTIPAQSEMSDERATKRHPSTGPRTSLQASRSRPRGGVRIRYVHREAAVFDGYEIINEACADGIRIPRSIERQYGLEGR